MRIRRVHPLLPLLTVTGSLLLSAAEATPQVYSGVFQTFTTHIERQVQLDKRVFVDASHCTQWFYKEERERRTPRPPAVQGVRFDTGAATPTSEFSETLLDCESRYPGGLDAARQEFGRAQTTLSLSLTFYEFALVGDRDDDQYYSDGELRDIVESFGLTFNPGLPSALLASMLIAQFDSVHELREFDILMSGMGRLYDQGYRFTFRDKEALNRIMG